MPQGGISLGTSSEASDESPGLLSSLGITSSGTGGPVGVSGAAQSSLGSFNLQEGAQARPAVHPALPETYGEYYGGSSVIRSNPDLLAYMIISLIVVGLVILIAYLNIDWIERVGFGPLYLFWVLVFLNGIILGYSAFTITYLVTGGSDAVSNKCFALLFWIFVFIHIVLIVWALAFFFARSDRSLPLALAFLYIFLTAFYFWLGARVLSFWGRILLLYPLAFAFLLFTYSWLYRYPTPDPSTTPPS